MIADSFGKGIVYALLVVALGALYYLQQRMVASRAAVSPSVSPTQQKLMQYLPVVFAVASLPISVQGLGTSQAAAIIFFAPFVPNAQNAKAAVIAYSLTMTGISIISSLVMGLAFLRRGAALGLSVSQAADAEGAAPLPST